MNVRASMKRKTILGVGLGVYLGLCLFLVVSAGLWGRRGTSGSRSAVPLAAVAAPLAAVPQDQSESPDRQAPAAERKPSAGPDEADAPAAAPEEAPLVGPAVSTQFDLSRLRASHATEQTVVLGSVDPADGYKFQVQLTGTGAALARATLSEFDNRNREDPQPLVLLTEPADSEVRTLSVDTFELLGRQEFPLGVLRWHAGSKQVDDDGTQSVTFTAVLRDNAGRDAFRFTKTYRVRRDSYDVEWDLAVENLCDVQLKTFLTVQGPAGLAQEGAGRDMRDVVAAYRLPNGRIESARKDQAALRKAAGRGRIDDMRLGVRNAEARFVWAAVTNKYFAAILRPVPRGDDAWPDYIELDPARYLDSGLAGGDADERGIVTFTVHTKPIVLGRAGADDATQRFSFQLYLGPKDKDVFDEHEVYDTLGYLHTINFMSCCCPQSIIRPLAFGIMALMKAIYSLMGPLGNYGVVIIILVLIVRLLLHPITKKSQVTMTTFQKINSHPRVEEIKKKYAGNPREMQRQMLQVYRDLGLSPLAPATGMLPMFIQMPIWIALWSAVYTSIDLRGAGFLPFWITDLSAPDALFRFPEITIPLAGWTLDSFNLLPILMGVFMFLQQKLMSQSTTAASTNPQIAQQQKMMMIMMPLMFPLMLYKGPSGVNLYIMSSMGAGVLEQIVIRKHLREKEAEGPGGPARVPVTRKTGGKPKKKKPKPMFRSYR